MSIQRSRVIMAALISLFILYEIYVIYSTTDDKHEGDDDGGNTHQVADSPRLRVHNANVVTSTEASKTLQKVQPQHHIGIGPSADSSHHEIAPTECASQLMTSQTQCSPARDVVYIKVHKTGSSTLQNIFYRFGDERNLTFMLPVKNFHIEGIAKFRPSGVLKPPKGNHYNILANHVRFFYQDFKELMPSDTKFVTLIREPASHFSSMYSYFVLNREYKVGLEAFTENPRKYYEKYNRHKMSRLSGRDPQLFELGLEKKDMYDAVKVDQYIQFLDQKMDLVLLTEYFLESLILLKNIMCWDMQTIAHLNSKMRVPLAKENGGNTSDTNFAIAADALKKRLNTWNAGDFRLYEHFNRTFWKKIDAYGHGQMETEVEKLKELSGRYEHECMNGTKIRDISYWSGPIGLKEYVIREDKANNMTCKRLGMSEPEFVPYLRKKHKQKL